MAWAALAGLPGVTVLCCLCFVREKISNTEMMTKTVMGIISISVRIYEIITFVHFQTIQD